MVSVVTDRMLCVTMAVFGFVYEADDLVPIHYGAVYKYYTQRRKPHWQYKASCIFLHKHFLEAPLLYTECEDA